jgi:hypothetical protein
MKHIILILILFTTVCFGQKYTYYIKLNKLLTTTKVDTALYKKYVIKSYKNNDDALKSGAKIGDVYYLPLRDNISLMAIVVPKETETKGSIENVNSYTTAK